MKNMTKLAGIIAFVAVMIFSITACDPLKEDEKDDFSLEGRWGCFGYDYEFSGKNFIANLAGYGIARGTFTHTATNITFNPTHHKSGTSVDDDYPWQSWQEWSVSVDGTTYKYHFDEGYINGNPVTYRFEKDGNYRVNLYIGDIKFDKW